MESINQRVIGRFVALTRYSGLVMSLRQLSRSFISPCGQVGEHRGGAGGCLASGDSRGIRAGATDDGSKFSSFVAQPLTSSIGAINHQHQAGTAPSQVTQPPRTDPAQRHADESGQPAPTRQPCSSV